MRHLAFLMICLAACGPEASDDSLAGGGEPHGGGGGESPEGGGGAGGDVPGPGPGPECGLSAECPWSMFCRDGECVDRGDEGDPCSEDRECEDGNFCEEPCTVLFCEPATRTCATLDKQVPCETWHECGADQFCREGSCRLDRSEGHHCQWSSWCQIGLVCDPDKHWCAQP